MGRRLSHSLPPAILATAALLASSAALAGPRSLPPLPPIDVKTFDEYFKENGPPRREGFEDAVQMSILLNRLQFSTDATYEQYVSKIVHQGERLPKGGKECPNGGWKNELGFDLDRDLLLRGDEVRLTRIVCRRPRGSPRKTMSEPMPLWEAPSQGKAIPQRRGLVSVRTYVFPGPECEHGGWRNELGTGKTVKGVFQMKKVKVSHLFCNGEPNHPRVDTVTLTFNGEIPYRLVNGRPEKPPVGPAAPVHGPAPETASAAAGR